MAANSSEEICNFKCSSCLNLNKERDAVKYCVDCQGYCCQGCVDMHIAFPTLKSHTLLDKYSFKSSVYATELPAVPTERCSRHEVKLLDMYCGNHDAVGCSTCMAVEHRSCSDVQAVTDVIGDKFNHSDVDNTEAELRTEMKMLQKFKESREDALLGLEKSNKKALLDMSEFKKDIVTLVDKIDKTSIDELEKVYTKEESVLREEKQDIEDELEDIGKVMGELNRDKGNKAQRFVLLKSAQKKLEKTKTSFASFAKAADRTIEFTANQSILDFLRQFQTFGKLIDPSSHKQSPRTTLYSVKEVREMNIKIQTDSNICKILGVCLAHGGLLLLADYSNKKLKRVDFLGRSIVDYCDLTANPEDVCCVNKQEAAVSMFNTIQFINLNGKMSCTRHIQMDHRCYGITHKDGRLYTATASSPLNVHDISGKHIKTITTDNSGKNIFKQNQHIAFSDSGEKMFVADYQTGLVTLDTEGNPFAKHECNSELRGVHDVCTDGRGNLFVSGHGSHTVLQISQDGKSKVGVVLKLSDGISNPFCVCFDQVNDVLIVSQYQGDALKMFYLN